MISVVWAIAGLLLILSEMIVPGFVIFFFGLGALLNAGLTAVLPALADRIPLQLVIWAASSGFALAVLRRYFARVFRGTVLDSDRNSEYVGKPAEVTERVSPDSAGRVRFEGTTWTAISYDETIDVGERVDIIQKEGTKLVVTRSFLDT